MHIVDKGIAGEVEIVDATIVEARRIVLALDFGGIPVVGTVNEGVVEHLAFGTEKVLRTP